MKLTHLESKTEELVDSFSILRTKLLLESFGKDDPKEIGIIQKQIEDLEHGLDESEFLALLLKYLQSVELDRQKLLLENDILRDELSYMIDKMKVVDQNEMRPDLEEQQRRDEFDNEIRTMNKALEEDLEFSKADVSKFMLEEEVISQVIDVSSDNIVPEIPMRTKVAAKYFTKYLNEYNFDVAVPTCQRFIKDMQSHNQVNRLEVAAILEIQAIAFRNNFKFFDAADVLKKSLTIYDEMLEVDNPLILTTLKTLIELYGVLDSDKQNLAKPWMDMAIKSEEICNFDTAVKHYRRILEIYEQPISKMTERSRFTPKRLAGDSLQQGQSKKAKTHEMQLGIQGNVASHWHPNQISAPSMGTHTNQQIYREGTKCSLCSCDFCQGLGKERRACLQHDLVLGGLPEMPFEKYCKDDREAIRKIGKNFNVSIVDSDIIDCIRAPGRAEKNGLARTLFVTFQSKAIRDAIYTSYKKDMKECNVKRCHLKIKDIFPGSNSIKRVYISERLPKSAQNLYERCVDLKRRHIIDRYFMLEEKLYIQRKIKARELVTPELLEMIENRNKNKNTSC